jgi:hypothetical protein
MTIPGGRVVMLHAVCIALLCSCVQGVRLMQSADPSIGNPEALPFLPTEEAAVVSRHLLQNGSPEPVDLGDAAAFAVLGATTVTAVYPVILSGLLGVSPGTSVTGMVATGNAADAAAAHDALFTAYTNAAALVSPNAVAIVGNIGGRTLTPGRYKSTSSLEISSGDLTLDAENDPRAVWVFQTVSTVVLFSDRRVILTNGAKAGSVFWQVGSSGTLGTGSTLEGTMMAYASISCNGDVTVNGRLLALTAAVTFAGGASTISLPPACPKIDLSSGSVTCIGESNAFGNVADASTCLAAIDGNPTNYDRDSSPYCAVAEAATHAVMFFELDLGIPHIVTSVRVTTNTAADAADIAASAALPHNTGLAARDKGFFGGLKIQICMSGNECVTVKNKEGSALVATTTVTVIDDNTREYTFPGAVGKMILISRQNSKLYLCDFQVSGEAVIGGTCGNAVDGCTCAKTVCAATNLCEVPVACTGDACVEHVDCGVGLGCMPPNPFGFPALTCADMARVSEIEQAFGG